MGVFKHPHEVPPYPTSKTIGQQTIRVGYLQIQPIKSPVPSFITWTLNGGSWYVVRYNLSISQRSKQSTSARSSTPSIISFVTDTRLYRPSFSNIRSIGFSPPLYYVFQSRCGYLHVDSIGFPLPFYYIKFQ